MDDLRHIDPDPDPDPSENCACKCSRHQTGLLQKILKVVQISMSMFSSKKTARQPGSCTSQRQFTVPHFTCLDQTHIHTFTNQQMDPGANFAKGLNRINLSTNFGGKVSV